MANMSYCRFENTYGDLQDCLESLNEYGDIESLEDDSNVYEKPYIRKLIELCSKIHEMYGEELDD